MVFISSSSENDKELGKMRIGKTCWFRVIYEEGGGLRSLERKLARTFLTIKYFWRRFKILNIIKLKVI